MGMQWLTQNKFEANTNTPKTKETKKNKPQSKRSKEHAKTAPKRLDRTVLSPPNDLTGQTQRRKQKQPKNPSDRTVRGL